MSRTADPGVRAGAPVHANVIQTKRLVLRCLLLDDASFILELLNEPSFLRFIGDKGVKNLDSARGYILKGPIKLFVCDPLNPP